MPLRLPQVCFLPNNPNAHSLIQCLTDSYIHNLSYTSSRTLSLIVHPTPTPSQTPFTGMICFGIAPEMISYPQQMQHQQQQQQLPQVTNPPSYYNFYQTYSIHH